MKLNGLFVEIDPEDQCRNNNNLGIGGVFYFDDVIEQKVTVLGRIRIGGFN